MELARRKDDAPSVEVELGVCQFDCPICKCNCQATFHKNKRHAIANGFVKSAKHQTSETLKSLNKGGCLLYFNYVKNALDNNSVREFHELQDVDYRSEDEQASDAITTTAINVLGSSCLQADLYVMCGLQDLIPGRRTDVTISDGGKNVNILLTQARKQLMEGSKKSLPELMPISSEHTPPYSNFVSNVDTLAWRNELSSEPMYSHQEARNTTAAAAVTAPAEARNMTAAAAVTVTAFAALTADGHNGRKGPKEGTGHILERVFERVFTGDKEDCGKGACTACTQRSCLHVCC